MSGLGTVESTIAVPATIRIEPALWSGAGEVRVYYRGGIPRSWEVTFAADLHDLVGETLLVVVDRAGGQDRGRAIVKVVEVKTTGDESTTVRSTLVGVGPLEGDAFGYSRETVRRIFGELP